MKIKKPQAQLELSKRQIEEKINNIAEFFNFTNPWIPIDDLENEGPLVFMNDEEVYYVSNIFNNLKTLSQKRALIDFIHIKCDEDTVSRFMRTFPKSTINNVMLNC